MQDIYLSMNIL